MQRVAVTSLALVMLGALAVYSLAFRPVLRRERPLLADGFSLPTRRRITPKLLVGAALFGIGWSLSGYCPGPALTAAAVGFIEPLVFLVALLAGSLLFDLYRRKSS